MDSHKNEYMTNEYMTNAKLFIASLKEEKIDVSEAYLFGSVVTGFANPDSDIDIAVVSSDFQGMPFYDIKKISKHRRKIDLRLEVHPFSKKDVESDPPQFFLKIRREGVSLLDD
jgi:uncharacterized protein